MATNPMQKKARNSMLLGIVIGLLIGSIVIVFLFLQLTKLQKEAEQKETAFTQVYVLNKNIKSGSKITENDLVAVQASQEAVPSDFLTINDITSNTIAKLNLTVGSILSQTLVQESTEKITSDLREQQYNMIVLPRDLEVDDYIDIRLTLPNGQDYVIVSKKKIKNINEDTVWLDLYEEETLAMSNAIVEAYRMSGSKIYATIYVEPGNQTGATPTYVPSTEVINLINSDRNITEEARRALAERYTASIREQISSQVSQAGENGNTRLTTKMEEEITRSKEARQEYFEMLNGAM